MILQLVIEVLNWFFTNNPMSDLRCTLNFMYCGYWRSSLCMFNEEHKFEWFVFSSLKPGAPDFSCCCAVYPGRKIIYFVSFFVGHFQTNF